MTPNRRSFEHSNADAAGSPPPGEPVFLAVGKLRRPHGVHGEILMDVLTDFPERLTPGKEMAAGPRHIPVQIRSVRGHDQALLIAFQDYDTPEQASELRNQILYTSAADEPALGEGEYYHHEMLGMQVFDEEGNLLGVLGDILETGANDVYVVRPENGPEILLPAIDEVILEISLKKKAMRVHLLPGLVPPPD